MGFLMVPKSVTLNDLERRNDRYIAFFSPNSVALRQSGRRSNNLVFSDISLMAIFAEVTENESIIYRHLRGHPLLDYGASESQSISI